MKRANVCGEADIWRGANLWQGSIIWWVMFPGGGGLLFRGALIFLGRANILEWANTLRGNAGHPALIPLWVRAKIKQVGVTE